LDWTSKKWSEYNLSKGEISHKRTPESGYYDYEVITKWFADLGITFKNVNRITYTENIGRGTFKCSEDDCTDELISSIKNTFDFYMNEKDDEYRPHYNSIMNSFNIIGLGIAIDEKIDQYYLTVHYAVELLTHPEEIYE